MSHYISKKKSEKHCEKVLDLMIAIITKPCYYNHRPLGFYFMKITQPTTAILLGLLTDYDSTVLI